MQRTMLIAVLSLLCSSAVSRAQQPSGGGWRESSRPAAVDPRYARVAAQPTAREAGATHAVYWQRVEEETVDESAGSLTTVKEYPGEDAYEEETVRETTYSVPITRREYAPPQAGRTVSSVSVSSTPVYSGYVQPTAYSAIVTTPAAPAYGQTFVQSPAGTAANCCCPTGGAVQSYNAYPVFQPFGGDGAQIRPGSLGQPTLYVPGQPLRNAFRFLAL